MEPSEINTPPHPGITSPNETEDSRFHQLTNVDPFGVIELQLPFRKGQDNLEERTSSTEATIQEDSTKDELASKNSSVLEMGSSSNDFNVLINDSANQGENNSIGIPANNERENSINLIVGNPESQEFRILVPNSTQTERSLVINSKAKMFTHTINSEGADLDNCKIEVEAWKKKLAEKHSCTTEALREINRTLRDIENEQTSIHHIEYNLDIRLRDKNRNDPDKLESDSPTMSTHLATRESSGQGRNKENKPIDQFPCGICNQQFDYKRSRNAHQAKCKGNKPLYGRGEHECTRCFKRFHAKSSLKFHLKNKH